MSLTPTQETNLIEHISGVSGVTNYGAGTDVHVSNAEKAALDNAANDTRQSAASSTNTVVTKNNTGLLTTDERAAIDNAVGTGVSGTGATASEDLISAANPLVANHLPIAVPVLQAAIIPASSTISYIVISSTAITVGAGYLNIVCPTLGVSGSSSTSTPVYVGRQGINGSNQSSAYQYFGIEDWFGAATLISNLAVYVTDVYTGTTADSGNRLDPNANTNVDLSGFYNLNNSSLVLGLSAQISSTDVTDICVRMNIRGRVSDLAASWQTHAAGGPWSGYPSPTIYRNVKQPYVAATTGDLGSVTIGSGASDTKIRISTSGTLAKFEVPCGTLGTTYLYVNEITGDITTNILGLMSNAFNSDLSEEKRLIYNTVYDTGSDYYGGNTLGLSGVTSWGRHILWIDKYAMDTPVMRRPQASLNFRDASDKDLGGLCVLASTYSDSYIHINWPILLRTGAANQSSVLTAVESTDVNASNIGTPTLFVTRSSLSLTADVAATDTYNIYAKTWGKSTSVLKLTALGKTTALANTNFGLLVSSSAVMYTPISTAMQYVTGVSVANRLVGGINITNGPLIADAEVDAFRFKSGIQYTVLNDYTAVKPLQIAYAAAHYISELTKPTYLAGLGGYMSTTYPLRRNSDTTTEGYDINLGDGIAPGGVLYAYSQNASDAVMNAAPAFIWGYRDAWFFPNATTSDTLSVRIGKLGGGGIEFVSGTPGCGTSTAAAPHIVIQQGAFISQYVDSNGNYDTEWDWRSTYVSPTGNVGVWSLIFGRNPTSVSIDPINGSNGSIAEFNYTVNSSFTVYSHRSVASSQVTELSKPYKTSLTTGGFMPVANGIYVFGAPNSLNPSHSDSYLWFGTSAGSELESRCSYIYSSSDWLYTGSVTTSQLTFGLVHSNNTLHDILRLQDANQSPCLIPLVTTDLGASAWSYGTLYANGLTSGHNNPLVISTSVTAGSSIGTSALPIKNIYATNLNLNGTDVAPIISSIGKNLISTYKNLYIRGGYGATTTADSSSVHITVGQAILTDVNDNGIMLRNGSYNINIGSDTGDMDTDSRSWGLYSVWLVYRDSSEFVAKLSVVNDLVELLANLAQHDTAHTYTHGLLIGHVYMYSDSDSTFCIQPSIQYGNTMRFLFRQDGDTNNSGTCYIADDNSNAFAMYSSASTNALAGIPSTVNEVEVVFIPLLTSGHASIGRIFAHPVPFAGTASSGEYPITELAFNYYTPELYNTRWICRGWLHLESANIYIQATAGTPFTVSGWRENI